LLDTDFNIINCGAKLLEIIPSIQINQSIFNFFNSSQLQEFKTNDFNSTNENPFYTVESKSNKIQLSGQINVSKDTFLFACSPVLSESINELIIQEKKSKAKIKDSFAEFSKINQKANRTKRDYEKLNRLSRAFQTTKSAVVFTNKWGEIIWCNSAYLKMTGYSIRQVIRKSPFQIAIHPDTNQDDIDIMFNSFNDSVSFNTEFLHAKSDGSSFWTRIKGQPIFDTDGEMTQYMALIEDITEAKRFNTKIIESETRLQSLIENLETGILLEDENRKVLLVNKKFCDFFGFENDPNSYIGLDCETLLDNTNKPFIDKELFLSQTCQIVKNKTQILHQEASVFENQVLSFNFIPVFKKGIESGFLWTFDDITLKYRYEINLKVEKDKYSDIIANINLGLIEVDNEGIITLANDSFTKISGYSLDELIGKRASDLLLSEENKAILASKENLRTRGISDSYEAEIINKNGEKRNWIISGATSYDSNGIIKGSIGIHFDITEKKILESQHGIFLKKLEKQNEQLKEYAKIVSHDLKSPLRSIHSLVSWIKEDNDEKLSEQSLIYLSMIESKIEKMDHFIEGILTYSKIDEKEITYEEIDLNEKIQIYIQVIDIPKNITIKVCNKLPTIIADKFRVQQLFQNLLTNAVNYIDKPTGIVEISYTEQEYEHLISIKDNGIGIAKANQKRIFKMFEKFTKSDKSTGIGLSIVNKVIENYKGKIWLESVENEGTTFYFLIPKSEWKIPTSTISKN
jgi:PAS domain S-box-containing protein